MADVNEYKQGLRDPKEMKLFITLHPPAVAAGSALLLQVLGRSPKRKRKRERGPPSPKRPNLIQNLIGTKVRNLARSIVLFAGAFALGRYSHW